MKTAGNLMVVMAVVKGQLAHQMEEDDPSLDWMQLIEEGIVVMMTTMIMEVNCSHKNHLLRT
jgi:hypothetical protein